MEIWKRSLGGGGKDSEGGDRKGCERGRLSRYDVLTGWRRGDELPAGGGIKVESDQRLKPYQAVKARPLTLLVPAPWNACRSRRSGATERREICTKSETIFFSSNRDT
jgi:hypothetical protein